MSLIEAMMTECAFMNKAKVSDGEGGSVIEWTQGASFQASVILENSSLATIAEALKESKTYRITTSRSVNLEYGDVIKRISDGATFKVTSESDDLKTPATAGLDIAQVTAERWELTS